MPKTENQGVALEVFYLEIRKKIQKYSARDFPGGTVDKNQPASAGDMSLISGSGRSSGEGNSNPLQFSCLENPVDREAWWATVHGIPKRGTLLNTQTYTQIAP